MASSILNSDDGVISGVAGIKATGGDDGVLVFQSKGTETAQINTDKQIVAAAGTASLPVLTTTGDLNTGIYFPAADNIGFATGGTIRGRWTTDGLCFGSDTAAANALDDYEQGTWTPVLAGGTTTTYTRQDADYTKIGNMVFIRGSLIINSIGNGSVFRIAGIPFTAQNTAGAAGTLAVSYFESLASNQIFLAGYMRNGETQADFTSRASASATMDGAPTIFGNSTRVDFAGCYIV